MIRRKVFSSYSEEDLINAIEERAFCEGYIAAQKEFGVDSLMAKQANKYLKHTGYKEGLQAYRSLPKYLKGEMSTAGRRGINAKNGLKRFLDK